MKVIMISAIAVINLLMLVQITNTMQPGFGEAVILKTRCCQKTWRNGDNGDGTRKNGEGCPYCNAPKLQLRPVPGVPAQVQQVTSAVYTLLPLSQITNTAKFQQHAIINRPTSNTIEPDPSVILLTNCCGNSWKYDDVSNNGICPYCEKALTLRPVPADHPQVKHVQLVTAQHAANMVSQLQENQDPKSEE